MQFAQSLSLHHMPIAHFPFLLDSLDIAIHSILHMLYLHQYRKILSRGPNWTLFHPRYEWKDDSQRSSYCSAKTSRTDENLKFFKIDSNLLVASIKPQ